MSKPESTGAKSLEEILASIRKSLADETPPEPRTPSLKAPQPQLKPLTPDIGGPAQPASAPAKGGGMLSAKLANGAGRGPSLDPDLSELLAGEPKKSASPFLAEPGKPAGANAPADDDKDKDPLWFLSRLSAAAAGPAGEGSAARARDAAKAPTPPAEEIKLSRPETLRASLPPLFDTTAEPAATVAKSDKTDKSGKAEAASGLTARTEPRVLTPLLDPTPAPGSTHGPAKEAPEPIKGFGRTEPSAPNFFGSAPAAIRDEPAAFKPSPGPMPAADKPNSCRAHAFRSSRRGQAALRSAVGAEARRAPRKRAGRNGRCPAHARAGADGRRAAGARHPPVAEQQPAAPDREGGARGGGAGGGGRARGQEGLNSAPPTASAAPREG